MNLAPIISAIKSSCTAFKIVGGIVDFDAVADGVKTTPSAYVVPLSDNAEENQYLSGNLQRVNVDFGVCIAVRCSVKPETALADLEALRDSVRSALAGKVIVTGSQPIRYAGGQLIDFQPGLIWWQDGYRTAVHIMS